MLYGVDSAVGSVTVFSSATCVSSFIAKSGAESAAAVPSVADAAAPGLGVGK